MLAVGPSLTSKLFTYPFGPALFITPWLTDLFCGAMGALSHYAQSDQRCDFVVLFGDASTQDLEQLPPEFAKRLLTGTLRYLELDERAVTADTETSGAVLSESGSRSRLTSAVGAEPSSSAGGRARRSCSQGIS